MLVSSHLAASEQMRGDAVEEEVVASAPILPADLKTPDKWVSRDARLIRLTGAHPFNCEPPLSLLFNEGFITPPHLHFVRNHGAAAAITAEEARSWTVSIEGMVEQPQVLSLRDLQENYETISLPVTLTCAGNRRKEQNLVRKTKGFSWGSAGTSTSFWTGALLCDVLRASKPQKGARYVVFEGAEDLPNGKYSTGVLLSWALDFDRGIMLSWKQNGEPLLPDHGRPLRVVIPGVIGGRSVKWLKRIVVQRTPPEGWYHKYDNRVIPTNITPEQSTQSDEWWQDERYAIYNLNLQSIIAIPEHNSTLSKTLESQEEMFTLQGFAYNGGGIQVSRVEISLDAGRSWIQSHVRYPEQELRGMHARGEVAHMFGGKLDLADRHLSFCWCFWKLDVPKQALINAKDVVVRGMDLNMVAQPRDLYWSVLGMLNNWWFRVAIVDEGDHIKFVHPTNLGASDGWMDRMKAKGQDPSHWFKSARVDDDSEALAVHTQQVEQIKMVQDDKVNVLISKSELAAHANWFVVQGHVYDGTNYMQDHPGGPESIAMVSGEDATEDFMAIHSENAKALLAKFHVGRLEEDLAKDKTEAKTDIEDEKCISATFLSPKKWKAVKLVQRVELSKDTRLLDFALDSPEQTSGLPVGAHVFVRLKEGTGEFVMRAYTPTSCHRTKGLLSLLVKVYYPDQEKQIQGGRMSMLLDRLRIGDTLEVKGPVGSFNYLGNGRCLHRGEIVSAKRFYMVSGGSGITPCYQIMKEVAKDGEDNTQCYLLFGNREHADVMCYEDLQHFKEAADGRISIDYWLSRPSSSTSRDFIDHKVGRIDHNVLDEVLTNSDSDDYMLMVCGPDGMVGSVKSWAEQKRIPKSRIVVF